jgi:hypothetical protein
LKAQTAPENWGDLEFGMDEHRNYISDSIDDHAEEDDYKEYAPAGIDQTYELNSKIWNSQTQRITIKNGEKSPTKTLLRLFKLKCINSVTHLNSPTISQLTTQKLLKTLSHMSKLLCK